ncbi:MAG: DUF2330 domain-containing protein [Polyangiaceae bacterium]
MRKLASLVAVLLCLACPRAALAFCGFYVSGADASLTNRATHVVLLRDGTRTVLSMQNAYEGPPQDFALVVPVPVVLQKEQVKTLPRGVLDRVDKLGAPRLVEYWEQDPCRQPTPGIALGGTGQGFGSGMGRLGGSHASEPAVKIEAQFEVGEYEILILSATDSTALDRWLREKSYKISAGAEPYLRPYVESGMKFFVAKVNIAKVEKKDGRAILSPLRFHYDSDTFSLPIRLGLINAGDAQDLIVSVLSKGTRFEVANYPNVAIPTNLDVSEETRTSFGSFYAALFDETLKQKPGAVVTEYAWSAGGCDPCPGPTVSGLDYLTLGGDALPESAQARVSTAPTNIRMSMPRVTGALPPEVIHRILRQGLGEVRVCFDGALRKNPSLQGRVTLKFTIGKDGKPFGAVATSQNLQDPALRSCIARSVAGRTFPKPEAGVAEVSLDFHLAGAPLRVNNLVLTRLHMRYTKDALGEDLVFKAAPAIQGGREQRTAAGLEQGAILASFNNFQARYAIRHPWTGPIECESPVRGVWGGPPTGPAAETRAATDLAFVPRGAALAGFLTAALPPISSPGTSPTSAPSAAPSASASATAPATQSATEGPPLPEPGGCSCMLACTESTGAVWPAGLLLGLLALLRLRRDGGGPGEARCRRPGCAPRSTSPVPVFPGSTTWCRRSEGSGPPWS